MTYTISFLLISLSLVVGNPLIQQNAFYPKLPSLPKEDWKLKNSEIPRIKELNAIRISEQHKGPASIQNGSSHPPVKTVDAFRVNNLKLKVSQMKYSLTSNPKYDVSNFRGNAYIDHNKKRKISHAIPSDVMPKHLALSINKIPENFDRKLPANYYENASPSSLESKLLLPNRAKPGAPAKHIFRILIEGRNPYFLHPDLIQEEDTELQSLQLGLVNVPHEIYANVPHKVYTDAPNEVYADVPHAFQTDVPHTFQTSVPHTLKADVPHAFQADVPHTFQTYVPHTLKDDVPHTLQADVHPRVYADLPHTLKADTHHAIQLSAPDTLQSGMPHAIQLSVPHAFQTDVPHKMYDDTPHEVYADIPHKIAGVSHKIHENHKIINNNGNHLVKKSLNDNYLPLTLFNHSESFENSKENQKVPSEEFKTESVKNVEMVTEGAYVQWLNKGNAERRVNGPRPRHKIAINERNADIKTTAGITTVESSGIVIRALQNKWTAYFLSQSVMIGFFMAMLTIVVLVLISFSIYNAMETRKSQNRLVETITEEPPEPPDKNSKIYSIPANPSNNMKYPRSFLAKFKALVSTIISFQKNKSVPSEISKDNVHKLKKHHRRTTTSITKTSGNNLSQQAAKHKQHRKRSSYKRKEARDAQNLSEEQKQDHEKFDAEEHFEDENNQEKQKIADKECLVISETTPQNDNGIYGDLFVEKDGSVESLRDVLEGNAGSDRSVAVQKRIERLRQHTVTSGEPHIDSMLTANIWDKSFYSTHRFVHAHESVPPTEELIQYGKVDFSLSQKTPIDHIFKHIPDAAKMKYPHDAVKRLKIVK